MRVVFPLGTAGKSGGKDVLLDIIKIFNELGIETAMYALDKPVSNSYAVTHPKLTQLQPYDVRSDDFLFIQEEFVFGAVELAPRTQKYVLINQGLFASFSSDYKRNTYAVTKNVYDNARCVIGNSDHTLRGVKRLFGVPDSKLVKLHVPISPIFKPAEKQNIIAYMPRKNPKISLFMDTYVSGKYLDYEIIPIHDQSLGVVATILGQAKYFMSFGGPEGLGMPPIEAAISHCKVIGFDGEAGAEYFNEPIFTKVPFYDHIAFLDAMDSVLSQEWQFTDDMVEQAKRLKDYYNIEKTRQDIKFIVDNFMKE